MLMMPSAKPVVWPGATPCTCCGLIVAMLVFYWQNVALAVRYPLVNQLCQVHPHLVARRNRLLQFVFLAAIAIVQGE